MSWINSWWWWWYSGCHPSIHTYTATSYDREGLKAGGG